MYTKRKGYLFLFIALILLSLLALVAYFSYRLHLKPPVGINPQKEVTPAYVSTDGSITKTTSSENGIATFTLEGQFINKLEKYGDTNLLRGGFVIRGDKFKHPLEVFIGSVGNFAYLGKYQDSFTGDSSWNAIPINTLTDLITPNTPVQLKFIYKFDFNNPDQGYLITQKVIDDYEKAINDGYEYVPPTDFVLSTENVGIIQ